MWDMHYTVTVLGILSNTFWNFWKEPLDIIWTKFKTQIQLYSQFECVSAACHVNCTANNIFHFILLTFYWVTLYSKIIQLHNNDCITQRITNYHRMKIPNEIIWNEIMSLIIGKLYIYIYILYTGWTTKMYPLFQSFLIR